jgi:PiT family inorganic phosphate transporter
LYKYIYSVQIFCEGNLMATTILLFIVIIILSYANGANDNFKGVATLYGSKTTSYRAALTLATLTTLAGSVASVFIAQELISAFSGKGLVPAAVVAEPIFAISVAISAACTVMIATVLGLPISTTHALVGGIFGAGVSAIGGSLQFSALGRAFIGPLLFSPMLAVIITMAVYFVLHKIRVVSGVQTIECICIRPGKFVLPQSGCTVVDENPTFREFTVCGLNDCSTKYTHRSVAIPVQKCVDVIHYFSAGAIGFARGLNDTPKLLGLLFVMEALDVRLRAMLIAVAMAIGGLLNARKVAETLSNKVTTLNDGQALSANLVTAALVIAASRFGLPVSTTHVSVGAISGVGIVSGHVNWRTLANILLAWCLTLPTAALIAWVAYFSFQISSA